MIQVTDKIFIDENDLQWDFVRSSGPGGQNVNKVSTAVQLRFNVKNSSLPKDVKQRLRKLAGRKMTLSGELIIKANRFRYQERNRGDALTRLIEMIELASHKPKPRRKTKPSRAAVARRLDSKQRQSNKKNLRKKVTRED
ncbi:MAG: aminoacyl-tRNA hydrolase [bacterium]|nr:aminoacyl-tRNA hydrolase [bacterium]